MKYDQRRTLLTGTALLPFPLFGNVILPSRSRSISASNPLQDYQDILVDSAYLDLSKSVLVPRLPWTVHPVRAQQNFLSLRLPANSSTMFLSDTYHQYHLDFTCEVVFRRPENIWPHSTHSLNCVYISLCIVLRHNF